MQDSLGTTVAEADEDEREAKLNGETTGMPAEDFGGQYQAAGKGRTGR